MLESKNFLVTGANDGIGKETARFLAHHGGQIIMICRNEQRGQAAQQELKQTTGNNNVHLYLADLASQSQIRKVCNQVSDDFDRIDVLVNNAGFMGYTNRTLTEDGLESTLAVNHLGPFMITNLLMPLLEKAPSARVVNVSSVAHKIGVFDETNLQLEKGYKPFQAYSNSKLMNILFTKELADRIEGRGITSNCLDPGKVYTGIGKTYSKFFQFLFKIAQPFLLNAAQGAETSLYLATSSEIEGVSGEYFAKKKPASLTAKACNKDDMKKLWEISARLTGMKNRTV